MPKLYPTRLTFQDVRRNEITKTPKRGNFIEIPCSYRKTEFKVLHERVTISSCNHPECHKISGYEAGRISCLAMLQVGCPMGHDRIMTTPAPNAKMEFPGLEDSAKKESD